MMITAKRAPILTIDGVDVCAACKTPIDRSGNTWEYRCECNDPVCEHCGTKYDYTGNPACDCYDKVTLERWEYRRLLSAAGKTE